MRYALTIKGRVQNSGYRNLIEKNARARRLRGYVFNDIDGTVKPVCDGAQKKIDEFIDVINLHEEDIFVDDIFKSEVENASPIPMTFARLQTDTLEDIGRKLDMGVGALEIHTGLLSDMKVGQDKLISGQDKHTDLLHDHTGLLKDMKDGQNKMIEILGKNTEILEKIAEK